MVQLTLPSESSSKQVSPVCFFKHAVLNPSSSSGTHSHFLESNMRVCSNTSRVVAARRYTDGSSLGADISVALRAKKFTRKTQSEECNSWSSKFRSAGRLSSLLHLLSCEDQSSLNFNWLLATCSPKSNTQGNLTADTKNAKLHLSIVIVRSASRWETDQSD